MGKRVIVAGLDTDYRGEAFSPIPELLAIAEYITKTHEICVVCGNPANFTQRTTKSKDQVLIGTSDIYEARCRNCYEPPNEEKSNKEKKKK
jgi:thymidine kinase